MTFFKLKWKRLAEGRAEMPPCPLSASSPSLGDYVIARALPEAISN